MALTPKQAKALTDRLDRLANHVEKNYEVLGLSKKAAYDFCYNLDQTADALDGAGREALTLEREQDEPYMDTFNSPKGPIETEADEPYMKHFEDDNDSQVAQGGDLAPLSDGSWEVESNWYDDDTEDSWF